VRARAWTSQNEQGRNAFGTGQVVAPRWTAVPQRVAGGQLVADRVESAARPRRIEGVNTQQRQDEQRGVENG
jgi:hypothetical protein